VTGRTLAELYCVGGAVLGLWALVRFPTLLGYSIAHGGKIGGVAGLIGLVLPALTAIFWSAGSLFRVFSGLFNRGVG
jgi:hypothetical protein